MGQRDLESNSEEEGEARYNMLNTSFGSCSLAYNNLHFSHHLHFTVLLSANLDLLGDMEQFIWVSTLSVCFLKFLLIELELEWKLTFWDLLLHQGLTLMKKQLLEHMIWLHSNTGELLPSQISLYGFCVYTEWIIHFEKLLS